MMSLNCLHCQLASKLFSFRAEILDLEILHDEQSSLTLVPQCLDRFWNPDHTGFIQFSQAFKLTLEHQQGL